MKIRNVARTVTKLAASTSVQMMIGGVAMAVVPPHISIIYKIAAGVGSFVVAACASEHTDKMVDKHFDELDDIVDVTKFFVDILKKDVNDLTKEEKELIHEFSKETGYDLLGNIELFKKLKDAESKDD